MKEVGYTTVAIANPNAIKNNLTAQRQLAEWLVRFGIEHGTIKSPEERKVEAVGKKETRLLCVRSRFERKEFRSALRQEDREDCLCVSG